MIFYLIRELGIERKVKMDYTILEYVKIAILGGLLGTGGMTLVLYSFDRAGLTNGDMVRAIGSIFTKSYENAFVPGIILHFLSGIIFSLIYTIIIDLFNVDSIAGVISYAITIGIFHGAVVALLLVVAVAEHHPIEKFQKAGFAVAFLHWGAHVVFGLIVGLIIGVSTI
jgi:hypothetical protein